MKSLPYLLIQHSVISYYEHHFVLPQLQLLHIKCTLSGGLFTKNCVFATTLLFPLHNVWIYNKTITLYTCIHTSQMMHTCLDCQPNLITTSETITLPSM